MKVNLESLADTTELAKRIAAKVKAPMVIGLVGELGSGKTTLVRALIRFLGGDNDEVSSPTYVLQHEYSAASGIVVEHWDLYRLKDTPLELEEPPEGRTIRIIEWVDRIPGYVDFCDLVVELKLRDSPDSRVVALDGAYASLIPLEEMHQVPEL